MTHSPKKPWKIMGTVLCGLLLLGTSLLAQRLPAPLLEGAAGKQTHTAMVARNLYRGQASPLRPIVDDVGKPGYFVKELPVLATTAAALFTLVGEVDESILRLLSALAWLGGTWALFFLLRNPLGRDGALIGCVWMLFSPMALVYAPSAMNDAIAVAGALLALTAISRWRCDPSLARAFAAALLTALAFLLKPHAALWLGPAAAWVVLATSASAPARPAPGKIVGLGLLTALALGGASLWYLHAAMIHSTYPVPGATVAEGWVDPTMLGRPDLYAEIGRQALFMVFTVPGALLGALGLLRGRPFRRIEAALLLWAAGSLLQGLVFAPRMFDHLSRGTEYYQLPLVPVAAMLIARGLSFLVPERWSSGQRTLTTALLLGVLCAFGVVESRDAAAPPERYVSLLPDCAQVRAQTRPDERFLVLADRGGAVLYYCDRKGQTMVFGTAEQPGPTAARPRARRDEISRAISDARYLYVPFPQIVPKPNDFFSQLDRHWEEVALPGATGRLFRRPRRARRPRGRSR